MQSRPALGSAGCCAPAFRVGLTVLLLGGVTTGHSCLAQDCGLELNDEDGHRCYPLEDRLFCHSCHVQRLDKGPSAPALHQHF